MVVTAKYKHYSQYSIKKEIKKLSVFEGIYQTIMLLDVL